MKVSLNELNKAIDKIVEEYSDDVNRVTVEVIRDVAADAVKKLKQTSPMDSGLYAKNWRYDTNILKSFGHYATKVFNRGQHQLTHLLEYGHDLISKAGVKYGRVDAKPHIKPVEEFVIKEYDNELKRRLNDIK